MSKPVGRGHPWRWRCPEGHASIEERYGAGYRCHACDRVYDGEPHDAKTTEFPV